MTESSYKHIRTNGGPMAYADSAFSVGRISLWVCESCGALVPMDYVTRHEEWHERLRRAVDEREMLLG
jgi:hypothetical protein